MGQYCDQDVQCLHDRACLPSADEQSDHFQRDICNHLTNCGTYMQDALTYIDNLKDCAQERCHANRLQAQYDLIQNSLNRTRNELQLLESTMVGHVTVTLVTTRMPPHLYLVGMSNLDSLRH